MLKGLDCTAAQLRTGAKASQCGLVRLFLAGACSRPRIIELIGRTEAANATDRRSTLFDGQKTAISPATAAAAIDCAPWIRIVRHHIGKDMGANAAVPKSADNTMLRKRIAFSGEWERQHGLVRC